MSGPYTYDDLRRLMTLMTGDEKHDESSTSTLDVLWVLYDRVLRVDPAKPHDEARDRFLLSKGHGPMAFYAVLTAKGFIAESTLAAYAAFHSQLGHHPDRTLIRGVEISSGSLGHGLPIAVGMAAALRAKALPAPRVFCLIGDAELDEGSNNEAICVASRMGLSRLVAIVVDNRSDSMGWPGGIAARFAVEGWSTATVDGRNHDALESALTARGRDPDGAKPGPHVVVAEVGRS